MSQRNLLKGTILYNYLSITNFADALGWDRKKASRIANRVQEPSVEDIKKMTEYLNINDAEHFVNIFFPEIREKWNEKELKP